MCDKLGNDQTLQPVASNCGEIDQTLRSVASNCAEIDHCLQLSEDVGALALNEEYSDVTFIVKGKSFAAHRVILAARCHYFRALLFGGMKESVPEATINVDDTTPEAFKLLLNYIYTGKLKLSDLKEDLVIEILALSNKYGFATLEEAVSSFLLKTLYIGNACDIYGVATLYSLKVLREAAAEFIDKHAIDILNGDSFLNLSLEAVKSIIERDSFCSSERAIFKAVMAWWEHNVQQGRTEEEKLIINQSREQLLKGVRFHLMPLQELLYTVRPSGLISPDDLLDAIQRQSDRNNTDLNYRGVLCPEENIATMQHGAQVVQGEMSAALLDGDTVNYNYEHGYTRHSIDDVMAGCKQEVGIVVKLGQPSIINHIRMLLWDKDTRSYSYYIEVSMEEKDWTRVVDHSKFHCRSWQYLYFTKRVVRFIRVIGTHNTVNKIFHLVSFEAMFTRKSEILDNGLIVPQKNVATVACCASVIEGVSRDRNALLSGEAGAYDWDSGYTCHQLRNGAIVIQLNQPYQISTIRLLLWDIDERTYNYYIETSVNQNDWKKIVDNTKIDCRSWQHLSFERRPVVFIRLVGTGNTANEVFHCVHFECPDSTVPPSTVNNNHEATRSGNSVDWDVMADAHLLDEDRGGASGTDITDALNSQRVRVRRNSARSDTSQQSDGSYGEGYRHTRHSRRSPGSFPLNPQKPK